MKGLTIQCMNLSNLDTFGTISGVHLVEVQHGTTISVLNRDPDYVLVRFQNI